MVENKFPPSAELDGSMQQGLIPHFLRGSPCSEGARTPQREEQLLPSADFSSGQTWPFHYFVHCASADFIALSIPRGKELSPRTHASPMAMTALQENVQDVEGGPSY